MRHHRRFPALALTGLMATLGAPTLGSAQPSAEWSFRGGFQLGFRSVDVEGREEKYKEDLNVEDGPRLFHLNLDFAPPAELRQYFDHLEMNMSNLGGDPFESLRFTVERHGRYALKLERRKSAYFYEDIILPLELAGDPSLAAAGDFHHFDPDRRTSASITTSAFR